MTPSEDKDIARRFGANLRRTRKAAGLTQEELATGAHLHRTEIGLLESGERAPKLNTIIKLAGAAGAPINALLDGLC